MNTTGSPANDDEATLREALQRDACRARQLPPFDPALHAATMRRIRALANAPHESSVQTRPALVDRLTAWFNQGATPRHPAGWLATAGALILIGFVLVGVRPPPQSITPGPVPDGLTRVEEKMMAQPGAGSSGDRVPSMPADRMHDARFNPGGFAGSGGEVRLLVASLAGTSSTARFDLEVPNGPIRLDCGYTLPDGGRLGVLLTRPTLGDSRPF